MAVCVAREEQSASRQIKRDLAEGMARRLDHLQAAIILQYRKRLARPHLPCHHDGVQPWQQHGAEEDRQRPGWYIAWAGSLDGWRIQRMSDHLCATERGQFRRAANMVHMLMRQQDTAQLRWRLTQRAQVRQNLLIAAG